jgi:hypothetical protein
MPSPDILWDPYADDFLPGLESFITLQVADELLAKSLHGDDWGPTPLPINDDEDDPFFTDPFTPPAAHVAVINRKRAALRDASGLIATLPFAGRKSATDLPLAFPRTGLRDHEGSPVSSIHIPAQVERATALLAAHILKRHNEGEVGASTLVSYRVGQTSGEFRPPSPDDLPRHVRKTLEPFLLGSASLARVRP